METARHRHSPFPGEAESRSHATKRTASWRRRTALYLTLPCLFIPTACNEKASPNASDGLTVYCSVDEAFARRVFARFTARTKMTLSVVFDSEAGKTTGLVNKIIQEARAGRPRADVFWSGELFNTIILARKGALEPYESPVAADIPARFKDRAHRWTALAARARVLAFDPNRIGDVAPPRRWEDLANPGIVNHVALANPLFGTTRGHVSAMFALWGPRRARSFLTKLREGRALIVDGNGAAVRAVIAGRARFAATDTDDVWVARRSGASMDLVYPDMGDGGTLVIPCSVALIRGCQPLQQAQKLVDFLVSAEVEEMLFRSDSRNIPVRAALRERLGATWPRESRVDYDAVADAMDQAMAAVREILIR